jgi:hypothetical protein
MVSRALYENDQHFDIFRIEDITGTGGKKGLAILHDYFRERKILLGSFKGKTICCVFFMDKDVDDLRRRLIRSNHVFYTALYDLEGHIYRDSNLRRAVAACLSIDIRKVPSIYNSPAEWIEKKR